MRRTSALVLLLLLLPAPRAGASSEEFSTFDVVRAEDDDESVIDHVLTRAPIEWRDEWEHAPQAFRLSQGCLTSANWFIETQLKTSSPLGRRARFELRLDQSESDRASWNDLELWGRFPQPIGSLGVMFRPYADKSRHDMALTWGTGADSSAFQLEAAWGFEDLFNNLWAFRQTQVGGVSEPYLRHPWEPALKLAARHPRWRVELAGKYLTPSEKRLAPLVPGDPPTLATLWGTHANAAVEVLVGRATLEARSENWQATSARAFERSFSTFPTRDVERMWSVESAVRAPLAPTLAGELRWTYLERSATRGVLDDPDRFGAVDRVLQAETRWALRPSLTLRAGGLYDRITLGWSGPVWIQTFGTRNESRAYFGLDARWGRVRLSAVEGIELDPEPYQVNFHHDKAFAQVQTTF